MADITENIPFDLSGRTSGTSIFSVSADAFDIAIGDMPFLLYVGENDRYERAAAPFRKEQFDAEREPGEQSLQGWWLRSQANFSGGSGITYHEPILGEGSENRFRDSRGIDIFCDCESGELRLLKRTTEIVSLASADISAAASSTRLLTRSGSTLSVWNGSSSSAVTLGGAGATTPVGLAHTGAFFLVGHNTGIDTLPSGAGTTTTQLWNKAGLANPMVPYWLKQRIFATSGRKIYELTMAGGDPDAPDASIYTHPDTGWIWTSMTETGAAVWAAGYSDDNSAIHVISVDPDGTTPTIGAATVEIQLPDGERVNAIRGYLNFLVIGTSQGLRVAVIDGTTAILGPLIFDDEEVFSLTARGDSVWAGLGDGLTRRVNLGIQIGNDLDYAWANDLETDGPGSVTTMVWFQSRLCLGEASDGIFQEHATELVPSGYLATGFARFGTLEPKYFDSVRVTADLTDGTIDVGFVTVESTSSVGNLANFVGSKDVTLQLPGDRRADRLSLVFTLNRDAGDATAGPVLGSYQLRALPTPERRQRLIRYPLSCFDMEKDRWGNKQGGKGFAWARLRVLEALENTGSPVMVQDFRTGEARLCVVEQVSFAGPENPSRQNKNFGGRVTVTVRTVD